MVYKLILTVHIGACLLMILVVLLQSGKGAGLMVFGGGGDSLINTPSGTTFIKKLTGVLAGIFAITSLLLTLISTRTSLTSVTGRVAPEASTPAPAAVPAAAPQKTP